jgi:hypothetical protein
MLVSPIEAAVMKTAILLTAASVLFVSSALAQSPAATNAPPPPGIHDPGVKSVEPAVRTSSGQPVSASAPTGDGKHMTLPDVSVHEQGDNQVQEYRRSGMLYMIVVTPKHGIPQTYMVDPQGRLLDEHGKKPVGTVMYKVLEWGKSKPASEESTAPSSDDGGH